MCTSRHADQFVSVLDSIAFVWNSKGQTAPLKGQLGWFPFLDRSLDAVQVSDDGQRIATLRHDRRIRVWDSQAIQSGSCRGFGVGMGGNGARGSELERSG
ncbi:MAG: hypothetical protein MUF72_21935 [Elainella sp. Prado103]|jgi:WD40 repeat protein|nr:hypothetical protein [Elainella sp. Prado103]